MAAHPGGQPGFARHPGVAAPATGDAGRPHRLQGERAGPGGGVLTGSGRTGAPGGADTPSRCPPAPHLRRRRRLVPRQRLPGGRTPAGSAFSALPKPPGPWPGVRVRSELEARSGGPRGRADLRQADRARTRSGRGTDEPRQPPLLGAAIRCVPPTNAKNIHLALALALRPPRGRGLHPRRDSHGRERRPGLPDSAPGAACPTSGTTRCSPPGSPASCTTRAPPDLPQPSAGRPPEPNRDASHPGAGEQAARRADGRGNCAGRGAAVVCA